MILTYRCPIPGITLQDQTDVCAKYRGAGDKIFTDTKTTFPKDRTAMIATIRMNGKAETILVSDLAVLASNREDLRVVRSALKAKGATILEGRTGRRSTNAEQLADMVQDAIDKWSSRGKRWSNKTAQAEDASKGGNALAKQRADRRPPKRLALSIWRDPKYTTDEAVAKINLIPGYDLNWTRSPLYNHLGPRKIPTGPMSARK